MELFSIRIQRTFQLVSTYNPEAHLYFLFAATLLYKLSNLLQETFFSLCSHVAFGLPDMNCVAKVLVMSFLYSRSQPDGSRQNLHAPLCRGRIWS